ncbi:baseplate J/gp47 family protein [Candidatus Borreliella tachyglossi]|uniref:baseplate J/gp47 family protein n=1 Tax=Candidatus Borreliella tachyglossi TaxID=1964448 RepID=UPI0040416B08
MYEENLRKFILLDEEQAIRQEFFRKARSLSLDTNSNSKDIQMLNLALEIKLDIRNETYSVGKNYDIRKSEGHFLDMEACKIGLRRNRAKKTTLKCKIISSGDGEISENTIFYYSKEKQKTKGDLEYKAIATTKFTNKSTSSIYLEALKEGAIYNLESGNLFTHEYLASLSRLEILEIDMKGEDEEDDDSFRARILREINGLTLRDTPMYYKRKLESTELIREVLIKRQGVNNTKFILRPHKETTTRDEMKKLTLETISCKYEVLEKIDYDKATKKTINIKLKKTDSLINNNIATPKLQKYINSLPMGGTFSIYDMYQAIGEGINIIEPKENQKAKENEYWEASITFVN